MDILKSFRDNCGFGLIANIDNKPSHKNLEDAITSLERMMHRGAVAADGKSGDGSGLLLSKPDKFMKKIASENGVSLPENYAVAMVFITEKLQIEIIKKICEKNDLNIVLIRKVPVNKDALGKQALEVLPEITQFFIVPNSLMATKKFDATLFLARREIENELKNDENFYIPSFSSSIIVYKGLIMPTYIKDFYLDLNDEDFKISFALFHQRFSTNTLPQWRLAQPFRHIAHNGEINSVEANRFNIEIKSAIVKSSVFTDEELKTILPILQTGSSDSASLDNMFEFLVTNGVDFFKAARALIPAPWQNAPQMDAKLRAYYEYTGSTFEAWDGPAAVSLTNGRYIGCVLDRNGLRPSKYVITKDNRILISSEYGVLDIDEDDIIDRGRLQSGQMIGIDLKFGKVLLENDINDYLKSSKPYASWLNNNMQYLQEYTEEIFLDIEDYKFDNITTRQRAFNITYEIIDQIITPMSNDGKEPVGSMGDDTPLSAFSNIQRNFTDFFKQKFAQVTNPPIDPYREKVVMSLNTGFGELYNPLEETENHSKRIKATSPILMKEKFDVLLSFGDKDDSKYSDNFKNQTFSTLFKNDLEKSIKTISDKIIKAVKDDGVRFIILDDRDISKDKMPMPMAMVVGRINQDLNNAKLRYLVSIIAVTGEVYEPHSSAVLLAYGATAIYPYLAYASAYEVYKKKNLNQYQLQTKIKNIQKALNGGILKIMSKMGIATVASYRNSGLFDILGLSENIVKDSFSISHSELNGLCYEDIENRIIEYHQNAYNTSNQRIYPLELGGFYKQIEGNEYHDYGPKITRAFNNAPRNEDKFDFSTLRDLVKNRDKKFIRDFFEFKSDKNAISINEVESVDAIYKRFAAAAMSCGSISPEAHEVIAEAMNSIGGQSNSGEGGEDPKRFGTIKNSKIKQIASGRFGVTPEYLVSAEELQIKVAQGAKPGEGGQLPGHKVTPLIASLRHTVAGVTLISPPPHHDIYSIEDLAQLIFDLKQINPKAKITVKLVSTIGVGTIAAGVAKAYADKIIISGADGGTGAAPLSSIKYTGNSWELGLSEAHNALKVNHLRGNVHLQTDGGLKTGLDVIKATMLGAESYAFGTAVLTLLGCKILRICHTNRCSVGVATQDLKLREHFLGTVGKVISYFEFIANDIREILASLGYKSLEEIVGRSDLLKVIDDDFAKKFNFDSILRRVEGVNTCQVESNEPFDKNEFEKGLVEKVRDVIEGKKSNIILNEKISNLNRSFATRISGEIARFHGDKGLLEDSIRINLDGIAGQSFGAFLSRGVTLNLNGAANDYLGKGMSGGKIIIRPKHQGSKFGGAGNTCLYGATGGKAFVRACVGERFAVRNSGTIAIVEGTGDHACEYMTGGIVVILGNTGINFGAGMTGGVAFIYDKENSFADKINRELIEIDRIDTDDTERERIYLKKLLKEFRENTDSVQAEYILDNFRSEIRKFWIVTPKDMTIVPLNPEEGD